MRRTFPAIAVMVVGLWAMEARAQYANRSLGLGFGAMSINAENEPVKWALPITLEGGLYIENGFEAYVRIPLMILNQAPLTPALIVGTGGQVGARYLFLEEDIRPWAGLEVAFLYIFRSELQSAFFGLGPAVGLDYFVTDTVSIGARGFFDIYITLNAPVRVCFGGALSVATHF